MSFPTVTGSTLSKVGIISLHVPYIVPAMLNHISDYRRITCKKFVAFTSYPYLTVTLLFLQGPDIANNAKTPQQEPGVLLLKRSPHHFPHATSITTGALLSVCTPHTPGEAPLVCTLVVMAQCGVKGPSHSVGSKDLLTHLGPLPACEEHMVLAVLVYGWDTPVRGRGNDFIEIWQTLLSTNSNWLTLCGSARVSLLHTDLQASTCPRHSHQHSSHSLQSVGAACERFNLPLIKIFE